MNPRNKKSSWLIITFIAVCFLTVSACVPGSPESSTILSEADKAAAFATNLAFYSKAWIDRPLDNTAILDPDKPVLIIGHASGIAVGSAQLKIKRAGTDLPALDLTDFVIEREGLTRITGQWLAPHLDPLPVSGEILYELRLVVNGTMESVVVHLRQTIPTPTATTTTAETPTLTLTVTPTSTNTVTPTGSLTASATTTPTETVTSSPTVSATATLTLTATDIPTPSETPSLTPSPTLTITLTATATASMTPSATSTPTFTSTAVPTPSPTLSATPDDCVGFVSGQGNQQIANVRSGPGTLYPIIGQLTIKDGKFGIIGKYVYNDGTTWWQIQFTADQKGFVSKDFVTVEGTCDTVPTVVAPPLPCKILQFSIDATTIQAGQSTTLRWAVQGFSRVSLNGQAVKGSGQMQVATAGTYTLNVNCSAGGTKSASVTLIVNVPPPPPPPPPPAEACRQYGQICSTSGQCCDNVPCTNGRCRYP